ncbi:MAG: PilZ domain-containing protein [Nitrospirae bacterium]|nr:PilZ domain-containing protein [Nitrospirota bacterium]
MGEIRKHPRFSVNFGSSFSAEQIVGQGTIANLSVGGCSIESKVILTAKSSLAIHVQLPDSRRPLQIDRAVVRWARGNTFGVEFQQMSQTDQLHQLIHDLEQSPMAVMQHTRV